MVAVTETGSMYSAPVAFIYVFNLIIGVGALTMPKAFDHAGWVIATVLVCVLCFMSFVTATFMFEAMAAANAFLRLKENDKADHVNNGYSKEIEANGKVAVQNTADDDSYSSEPSDEEKKPLLNCDRISQRPAVHQYEITTRIEMGQMAKMFFGKIGLRLFFFCIVVYLYGDLAIYAAAVPMSLTRVACGTLDSHRASNTSNHSEAGVGPTVSSSDKCWGAFTEMDVYRIFLAVFTACLGPFTFFNVQKTKYLQLFTTLMRWIAFLMMIGIAITRIDSDKTKTRRLGDVTVANFAGIPNLFGVCVYSFMCQHSLPSMITPLKNKRRLTWMILSDFSLVLLFYALLSFSALFAFDEIKDLYTLNFWHVAGKFPSYYLALFPVFTLSTNFPIISITLRDNLKNLFYRQNQPYHWFVDRIVFPLGTILPPIVVAFATHNLQELVGVTGSYAGTGVQYVIPAALVYYGRKTLRAETGFYENKHRSPFRQNFWVIFVMVWSVICVALVTANHIITRT